VLTLKNGGFLNDKRILAVIKEGPNYVALMEYGHRIVLHDEEYKELVGEEAPQK
jgi:hypothetical protein